jgi:hypothetical protein
MTDSLPSLADTVLPLMRSSRRDLWKWDVSNEQGDRMHHGLALLEVAFKNPRSLPLYGVELASPKEVYRVTHRALASAVRVIARADDSSGIIGDACVGLIDLHARAAAMAGVPPLKLADWMFDFHFDDQVDFFNLDPVAYAPALGEKGLARLRARIDALRAEIPPADPGVARFDHRGFVVEWFDKRLAVLDRDVEAIIRTHLRDGRVAAWHEDVAKAFEEIERYDLAIEWAERATRFDLGFQSQHASHRWWRLLAEHSPSDLPDAARVIFSRWPSASTGVQLVDTVGTGALDEVLSTLASRPADLVRFQLEHVRDPRLAWETAHRLELRDDRVWSDLAEAYFPIDPVAAIQVQLRLVAASVREANTRAYRPAARELATLRKSATRANSPEALALVDSTLADLRERYRRRPSFLAALDRARLP